MSSAHVSKLEYKVLVSCLPLYDSPLCTRLATQAWKGRHFTLNASEDSQKCSPSCLELPHLARSPWQVTLCEDAYQCWLAPEDVHVDAIALVLENERYRAHMLSEAEIRSRTGLVIDFAMAAYKTPNTYLWGGTCGPNFDCSGLVQRAFAAAGIWIPRDAHQQERFVRRVPNSELKAGDLVFFGRSKATHVGIILEDAVSEFYKDSPEFYKDSPPDSELYGPEPLPPVMFLHSSGKEHGHGRIDMDNLGRPRGSIGLHYCSLYRGAGRVTQVFSTS